MFLGLHESFIDSKPLAIVLEEGDCEDCLMQLTCEACACEACEGITIDSISLTLSICKRVFSSAIISNTLTASPTVILPLLPLAVKSRSTVRIGRIVNCWTFRCGWASGIWGSSSVFIHSIPLYGSALVKD